MADKLRDEWNRTLDCAGYFSNTRVIRPRLRHSNVKKAQRERGREFQMVGPKQKKQPRGK